MPLSDFRSNVLVMAAEGPGYLSGGHAEWLPSVFAEAGKAVDRARGQAAAEAEQMVRDSRPDPGILKTAVDRAKREGGPAAAARVLECQAAAAEARGDQAEVERLGKALRVLQPQVVDAEVPGDRTAGVGDLVGQLVGPVGEP